MKWYRLEIIDGRGYRWGGEWKSETGALRIWRHGQHELIQRICLGMDKMISCIRDDIGIKSIKIEEIKMIVDEKGWITFLE